MLLALCFCLLVGGVWIYKILKKRNLPPGPFGFPVVGYLPALKIGKVHLKLRQLGKKYGPIFSLQVGSKLFVVLTSASAVREAYSKAALNGKLVLPFYEAAGISNTLFENGPSWNQHRKLLTQVFKTLGVGKSSVNDLISDEVQSFLKIVSHSQGAPFKIREPLYNSLTNILSCLLIGEKLGTKEQSLLNELTDEGFRLFEKMAAFVFFPWLLNVPGFHRLNHRLTKDLQKLGEDSNALFKKKIDEATTSKEMSDEPNYTNIYLSEMRAQENNPENTLCEKSLLGSIFNIFGAAATFVSALEWCLYVVANFPQFQRKIHKEIDKVLGRERIPTFADLKCMPYTHSYLMEVQRHYTSASISWPRTALEEITIMGYTIPKGTCVASCLHAVHHDPDYWDRPDEIIPERFLTPDKESVNKPESYMPFSFGKRNCPGENLANVAMFYYFTSLLQKFELSAAEGEKLHFEGKMGAASLEPESQNLCFFQRV